MEKLKEALGGAVKKAASCAAGLCRSAVQLLAWLGKTVAGFAGEKLCGLAKTYRQPLLLTAAIVSAALALGSGVLWLLGRKK